MDWLLLDGFFQWEQPVPLGEDKFEVSRRAVWYIIQSYIVKEADVVELYDWATAQDFLGRWMPEGPSIHDMFLGEYPWAKSVPDTDVWSDSVTPKPVGVSAATYVWEASSYDCSVDDTITVQVPSPWLVQRMQLRSDSTEGQFMDANGRVVTFDPAVRDQGPSVLLANKTLLLEFLKSNGYALIWTVLGEKQIHLPLLRLEDRQGWLGISGCCRIKNGKWDTSVNLNFHSP